MADIDVVPKSRGSKGWIVWMIGLALVALAVWMLVGGMATTTPN